MGREPTNQGKSDLFSAAGVENTSPPATNPASSANARPHVLPKDLPNAVKHLNDEELDRLLVVTLAEAAFKAGITPTRIARQFGLSQGDVRAALKSDKGE